MIKTNLLDSVRVVVPNDGDANGTGSSSAGLQHTEMCKIVGLLCESSATETSRCASILRQDQNLLDTLLGIMWFTNTSLDYHIAQPSKHSQLDLTLVCFPFRMRRHTEEPPSAGPLRLERITHPIQTYKLASDARCHGREHDRKRSILLLQAWRGAAHWKYVLPMYR